MEAEQGDVGSAVSLSGKTKVTEENVSVKNQAWESYEGRDGDEIMVEIVGSDVLVDGVGGDKGSNFEMKEIGELDGNTLDNRDEAGPDNDSEAAKDVLSEGDWDGLDKIHPVYVEKLIRGDNVVGPELTKHPLKRKITFEDKEATNNGANGVQVEGSEVSHKFDSEAPKNVVEETGLSEASAGVFLASSNVEPVASVSDVLDEKSVSSDTVETVETTVDPNVVRNDPMVIDPTGRHGIVEEDFAAQVTETDKAESTDLIPAEVAKTTSDTHNNDIVPDKTENKLLDASACNISIPCEGQTVETLVPDVSVVDDSSKNSGYYIEDCHTSETEAMDVDHKTEHHGGNEEPHSETVKMNQLGYLSREETDGHYSPGDLVWGKVRSHPWWPGQIFDDADASELALKYFKKDSYLVAYFGDHTFAWNDSSVLKRFGPDFSQIEKQSNSEAFQNAVDCALQEVSRRTELGLTCSCTPKGAYGELEAQVVENTGLRKDSSRRYGLEESFGPVSFEPDKLLKFVKDLASSATSGVDRLDLSIARAQLSGFCRFKGYRLPSEFPSVGKETDADVDWMDAEATVTSRRKHVPEDATESKKERSIAELMSQQDHTMEAEDESDAEDPSKSGTLSSAKKRKLLVPVIDAPDEKMSVYGANVSASTFQNPKPSFKVGECIRRVANQLTGATSSSKSNDEENVHDVSINKLSEGQSVAVSLESSSVDEMLLQLMLWGQTPTKKQDLRIPTRKFFSLFRSSIALNKRGRKKKNVVAEEFEFDDVNDSYWRDKIVQNYSEEQLNENGNLQLASVDLEKYTKQGPKPHSRKRYSTGSYPVEATEDEAIKRRKQESSPAELILNFAERNFIPAEINLNKIFRRFGPIMESETEVDVNSGRARVIFKRGSDAEVAHSSAEKFNIFGPALVNYQIGYTPVISVKILPIVVAQSQEDPTLMAQC